jgi:hypothetical protein
MLLIMTNNVKQIHNFMCFNDSKTLPKKDRLQNGPGVTSKNINYVSFL